MAGHSHAKNVKRKKESNDKKRADSFSKMARLIISSVREKGRYPETNHSLRTAIEKAKEVDMPKENIERAIKRGAGQGEKGTLEPFSFEAYGPRDIALIIEGSTDNKNRNLAEIKEVLKKYGGKIADPGSVKWLFDQKGIIEVEKEGVDEKESLEIIEQGVQDIEEKEDSLIFYTSLNDIEKIKEFLNKKNIKLLFARPGWVAKSKLNIEKKNYKNLLEDLQEIETVEEIYINT